MSRWAEMFADLSRSADTVDTLRHSEAAAPTVSRSVHSVTAVKEEKGTNAAADFQQPMIEGSYNLDKRAALVKYGAGVPRAWAEGFATLSMMPPPTGFSSARWQRIVDAAGTFIDRWAADAARCGWSDLDVFGCNPHAPDARFDAMGLVMLLDRSEVVAIDERGADILFPQTGSRQRYRLRPLPSNTVSLWQLCTPGEPAA